ncbi:MAG: PglZ domain-containing protein [Anaerolineales bacterium]|nr:PglZ domain-containing protein [Anaerolineales bacterium]
MDEILLGAVQHLLEEIDAVVQDLLVVEIDWGDLTPQVSNESITCRFQNADWQLIYTESELELRRTLCQHGERVIGLIHSAGKFQLPLDLRQRISGGAPKHLGLRHYFYAVTKRTWPTEVDYPDWKKTIENHSRELVRLSEQKGALQWAVSRDDLEKMIVQVAFGLDVENKTVYQIIADLLTSQRKSGSHPSDLERSLLNSRLRVSQTNWSDVIYWAIESGGRAEDLVRTGVIMAAEQKANLLPNWGNLNSLRALLVNENQMAEKNAIETVIDLSVGTLEYLHPSTRQSLLKNAESMVENVLPQEAYNPWFQGALEREIQRIARQLASHQAQASARIEPLKKHIFANQYNLALDVLNEMSILLSSWNTIEEQLNSTNDVFNWASWYSTQGSHLDLCALRLMHMKNQATGLNEHIDHLLNGYWKKRSDLNKQFGQTYIQNYEAALHDKGKNLFGTNRILEWRVRPLLQKGKQVLLVIVDGMAYPLFWHLMSQMEAQRPSVYIHSPESVLALLPSVTSVSRKAIFLNALPTDRLDDEQTYEGKARASEIKALSKTFPNHHVKLYNKSNLNGGQELLTDLQFSRANLVVVIYNVVDDDLKSATTSVRLPRLEDFGSLMNAVNHALRVGWEVIVTADHGHTWYLDKSYRLGEIRAGDGERFLSVQSNEVVSSDAVVTQDANIVRLQDGQQIAFLTATGAYYGHNPRRGFHGGASLEEIVVPCVSLTYERSHLVINQIDTKMYQGEGETDQAAYDLSSVSVNLPSGKIVRIDLPFSLSQLEARLLQTIARLGQASEAELKKVLGTRRVSGPIANLRERLAAAGPKYDFIEEKGTGPDGVIFHFRQELLK